jgi:hypothetical protein
MSWPIGRGFAFEPRDLMILDRLEELADGQVPAMLQLTNADLTSLLPAFADHPNVTLGQINTGNNFQNSSCTTLARCAGKKWRDYSLVETKHGKLDHGLGNWAWQNNRFQPVDLPETWAV